MRKDRFLKQSLLIDMKLLTQREYFMLFGRFIFKKTILYLKVDHMPQNVVSMVTTTFKKYAQDQIHCVIILQTDHSQRNQFPCLNLFLFFKQHNFLHNEDQVIRSSLIVGNICYCCAQKMKVITEFQNYNEERKLVTYKKCKLHSKKQLLICSN